MAAESDTPMGVRVCNVIGVHGNRMVLTSNSRAVMGYNPKMDALDSWWNYCGDCRIYYRNDCCWQGRSGTAKGKGTSGK